MGVFSSCHGWARAAPRSAVAELGVVRRFCTRPVKDDPMNEPTRARSLMRSLLIFIMPSLLCIVIRFALSPRLQLIHPSRRPVPNPPWPALMSSWDAGLLGLFVGGIACLAVAVYLSPQTTPPRPMWFPSWLFVFLAAVIVNGSIALGGCAVGDSLLICHEQLQTPQ